MENIVKAQPTKEFFVNMLVRDILLKEAIIELVDNCIDGARNTRKDNLFGGLEIEVTFDGNRFSIKDNCGGIPLEVASECAFRFGRPKDRNEAATESTGIFGIGMKRALFKMGSHFVVKSQTIATKFEVELDVNKWLSEDEWDFKFASMDSEFKGEIGEAGTLIEVTNLYNEIAQELVDPNFEKEVIEHIQRRVGLDIAHGISIIVNGTKLVGKNIVLINNEDIKPVKEEYEDPRGVTVKILAGITPREGAKYDPDNAGWYIYCNGRLVVAADKTSLTTWKDLENRNSGVSFHNDYAGFRGVVFFNSITPDKLPWNTTKTGIDETSAVYLMAKAHMLEVFKIVKSFLDEMKNNSKENDDGIEESVAKMQGIELTNQNVSLEIAPNRELAISRVKIITNPMVTITYKKPKDEVEKVKELLEVTSNRAVGEKTFEYYIDAEC